MPSLLIVGGLTVDHFADGTRAPGGSVLHCGLAAATDGAAITMLTVAGDEPEAMAGLDRLRALGEVRRQRASATTAYRHDESGERRVLVYERAGDTIEVDRADPLPAVEVALLAPIAGELPPAAVTAVRAAARPRLTVLLAQGWLRHLVVGEPVRPLALEELPASTWDAFAQADAIVLSTEDLAETPGDPFAQAASLRARLAMHPLLVLTVGPEGYLLDDPHSDGIVAHVPRSVVEGVTMVGAGDTFGATLALHLARGKAPEVAAAAATEAVIAVLEARRA